MLFLTSAFSPVDPTVVQVLAGRFRAGTTHQALTHFTNTGILFTVWTPARLPTKPHGQENNKGTQGQKSPTYKEISVCVNMGGRV